MNRDFYFLQEESVGLESLYIQPSDSNQEDNNKKTAANKLVRFVGSRDHAFEISKVINHSGLCHPFLTMLMKSDVTPFKLPLNKKGNPAVGSKAHMSYTFSKNVNEQTVIHFAYESKPTFFQINEPGSKSNEKKIPLDESSFLNYSYDFTCNFDNDNNLTMVPSNIQYDVKMKAGFNEAAESIYDSIF
jgi:hypothetical protein